LETLLPIKNPKFSSSENKITYTWIGHSTAVLSIGDQANIIIDPVFSHRSSPFQWIGPERYRAPACEVKNLPTIHGVFVSHDHYDHLDEYALNDL
jgi:N-acyl-phosphatidylethanolamine-hydrolysing phospholipase D